MIRSILVKSIYWAYLLTLNSKVSLQIHLPSPNVQKKVGEINMQKLQDQQSETNINEPKGNSLMEEFGT